jgi:hypothetical protein
MNEHDHWKLAGACLFFGAVVGVYIGHGTVPAKVIEKVVTVEVAKATTEEVTVIEEKAKMTIVVHTTWEPDGTVTREERAEEEKVREIEVVREVETERIVFKDREKVTEAAQPQWRVTLDLGMSPLAKKEGIPGLPGGIATIGGERRIAGPFWIGAWASSEVSGGIRASVEF